MTSSKRTAGLVSGKYVATAGAQWMSRETFTPVVSKVLHFPPHSTRSTPQRPGLDTGVRARKRQRPFGFAVNNEMRRSFQNH